MDTFKSGSRTAIELKEVMWFFLTDVFNKSNSIPDHLVYRQDAMAEKNKQTLNDTTLG